jgi:hypothetical protein
MLDEDTELARLHARVGILETMLQHLETKINNLTPVLESEKTDENNTR